MSAEAVFVVVMPALWNYSCAGIYSIRYGKACAILSDAYVIKHALSGI